jgi:diguanylate cyclase (GGDEF)-like protein
LLTADSRPVEAPAAPRPPPAVLVVSDLKAQRAAIGSMLDSLDVVVVEAESGDAALDAVLRQRFALILINATTPTMDGYETAKLIRPSSRTPIIFVSASGRENHAETIAAYASGAVDFIFTPVVPDVLRAKVSVFVELFVQAQELRSQLESITTLSAALRDSEASTQTMLDISERKAYAEGFQHQALHDGLTGLANRTLFGEHVFQALASAKRNREQRAVLVINLDGLTQVNDRLGHVQGDILLEQLGMRLGTALRETDTIARLGGDELAILPGGATDLAAATALTWKIEQTCRHGFVVNDEFVHVSASIGIALFPEHGRTPAELLRHADAAMNEAKRRGSAHAICDTAQETHTDRALALRVDLRRCTARDELVLYYQPKIDLGSRDISGVEALLRWRHPVRGLLQPASFIPELERTELIVPVTRWVLDEALRQQQAWREEGVDLTMAVNISAGSLRPHSNLADSVEELTETWGTAPDRLTLELTEGALIEAAAPDVLGRLHDMGEKLSIDDFGTGYSSLACLQRLPMDEIKIDRSFVTSLATASDDEVIVRSSVDLAHNLGLSVVAEGVEDDLAEDLLVGYGCDRAQGYLFSRPRPAQELTTWLLESPYDGAGGVRARSGQPPPGSPVEGGWTES